MTSFFPGSDPISLTGMVTGTLDSILNGSREYVKGNESDYYMWAYQTRYNTPANQMQRLKEAGLNPNLMYSQGNTGNASAIPTGGHGSMSDHSSGFSKIMGFLSDLASLSGMIREQNRQDKQLDLEERRQDLDYLKFADAVQHQQDALDLQKKRMEIDLAFRDKDYDLRKAEFDWRKSSYQPRQDSATTLANKLISNVIGKNTTDVATDTHNILERGVSQLLDMTLLPYSFAHKFKGYKPQLRKDLSGVGKVRY